MKKTSGFLLYEFKLFRYKLVASTMKISQQQSLQLMIVKQLIGSSIGYLIGSRIGYLIGSVMGNLKKKMIGSEIGLVAFS